MEILSPAGNFLSLETALKNGADAVYIGGESFSARKNAKNFTKDEIVAAADLCHKHFAKLYVACNILIKENELKDAVEYIIFLVESGVDGVIIQDLGIMSCVRSLSDDLALNVSTQATVTSADGANVFKKMGANRVVLARELSKTEIENIKEKTDLELEVFVHGALCMCYSGQCLLSSVIGGRSGNRGLCAQPCRLNYTLLKDQKPISGNVPLLSTKDLCLAYDFDEVLKIADSAKIEGRMKSEEYTGSVTKVYKKAKEGTVTDDDISEMLSFFSRGGSSEGYFHGRTYEEMMDYSGAKEKILASKEKALEVMQENFLRYREIEFCLFAKTGEKITLSAKSGSFCATATGDILEKAKNENIDTDRLKAQLKKLGGTCFVCQTVSLDIQDTPFIAIGALNALRREVCENIENQICQAKRRKPKEFTLIQEKVNRKKTLPEITVSVTTKEQLRAAQEMQIENIYAAQGIYEENEIYVCPPVTKEGEKLKIPGDKTVIQNIGQIEKAKGKTIYSGIRLNVTNSLTVGVLQNLGAERIMLSAELNLKEIKEITENTNAKLEIFAYGRLPVMVLENCVIKSVTGECQKGGDFALKDRQNAAFPIICDACKNIVLNSVPIYMADKMEDILKLNVDFINLSFTTESREEVKMIIEDYKNAVEGKMPKIKPKMLTRGHFYRGVL